MNIQIDQECEAKKEDSPSLDAAVSLNTVEISRAAAKDQPIDLFPAEHPLHALVLPTFSSIRAALAPHDISVIWNSSKYDESRRGKRTSHDETNGPGSELLMPLAGAYLCNPGFNTVFFPEEIDRTLIAYMQAIGFLGKDVAYIKSFQDMYEHLRSTGRKVYSVDDLPQQLEPHAVNSNHTMTFINSKENVSKLSRYAPAELLLNMESLRESDHALVQNLLCSQAIYLKTCNTESAGAGVHRVSTHAEFTDVLTRLQREAGLNPALSKLLIVQPEICGTNKSFQIFMDPENLKQISVLALTDQLIGSNGVTYAGSVNHDITPDRLESIGPAIIDMVERIQQHCPATKGFVMCDYFEQADSHVVLFDPGLRPTGNTVAAMIKLWLKETTGKEAEITNRVAFDLKQPGIPYAEIVQRLGKYADPATIKTELFGALPQGHNHIQGKTRLVVITPSKNDYAEFHEELKARLLKS